MADQPNSLNSSHARKRKGRVEGSLDRPTKVVEKLNEGEPPNQKFKPNIANSTGSPMRSKETKCTVVSQTLSPPSGKSLSGKDGLVHRVKSEQFASKGLFTPDKVRVRTDKTTGSGLEVKVKIEKSLESIRSPDPNNVESVKIKKEESPKKKPTVVSSTISSEQVKNRSDSKPVDKAVSQPRRGILNSNDEDSDDDIPLTKKIEATKKSTPAQCKKEEFSDEDNDIPLSKKMASSDSGKAAKSEKQQSTKLGAAKEKKSSSKEAGGSKSSVSRKRPKSGENDSDVKSKCVPSAKRVKSNPDEEDFKDRKSVKKSKSNKVTETKSPEKKKKVKEEPAEVWKWWEEAPLPEGVRWLTLEHKGPYFAPLYIVLPKHVFFKYDGKPRKLSPDAEEVAGFFAKMLDHDYTSKEVFKKNFWEDWRKAMTSQERKEITDFDKCDFTLIHEYYKQLAEEKKQMTKEEKQKIKEENEKLQQEYGICIIDGHKEKIGNWKIEPPGLFRGRGDHPKMGKLKKRTQPEDVTINIGQEAAVPVPPAGRKWKCVQHDNKVTWLAAWNDSVTGNIKYVLLNASSRLKGEKDWQKYETARNLKKHIDRIRQQYREDWKAKMMHARQRAVALYFIDVLALRAGNEKDTDEEADTVGCCSLRIEHITLHDSLDGQECVVEFDFLGKDSVRYYNRISVEARVYKNLKHFIKHKEPGDDLFDRLSTSELNKHLQELMPGLTAKVFRTYNASITLQNQLEELTNGGDSVPELMLSYNRANRQVAILCNHQRAVPKTFEKSMANLKGKIDEKLEKLAEAKKELKQAKKEVKDSKSGKAESALEKKKAAVKRVEEQLRKLEVAQTDKEENKTIALGTSKLNYLDPRISVAWCKKYRVPVEKVYNKTQRDKFNWAIDMADETFVF